VRRAIQPGDASYGCGSVEVSSALTILGGLGLFLLGIHHLTDGLKSLAGDSLRRGLQKLVSGHLSAIASGALFTATIQSSTAAILTVIGFVSAGLITFSQAAGVIIGATLGTTSTPWLVAIFGFRLRIATAAMPILGVGALLWLVGKGRARSLGAILAGFGLLFNGIEYMQNGMAGVSWNLESFTGPGSLWILAAIGVVMTIVMQSSSAAAATTLVALNAGSLTFEQGCAMIVGQSIGTTGTTALLMIGGGLSVRRAALAHILFALIVGLAGMLLLGPLVTAADWLGSHLDDPNGVLALAAFSSIFKLAGVAAFYPWIDPFSRFVVRLSGSGSVSAVSRLEPSLVNAGAAVALEAAWRAILELARDATDAVRGRLAGETVEFEAPIEAVEQTEQFLKSISLETIDLGSLASRLILLVHALDHLRVLQLDLERVPPVADEWQPPLAFDTGARVLATWLDLTAIPEMVLGPDVVEQIEEASKQLTTECRAGREGLLQDLTLARTPMTTGRAGLDAFAWADRTFHHTWRLAESLRVASGSGGSRTE
jgi:phosphate:Na+ symporter